MSRVWFDSPLETVATFWRILRRDGVALGFVTHDRDLWFDGLLHRTAPGMVPSAIRRSADLEPDSAEVQGVLSHDAIAAADLVAGRFDGARVLIGLVDWQSRERHVIYRGSIGTVGAEADGFTATLDSRKAELHRDPVPRTSPSCRATFCGPGCTLSAARFTHAGTAGGGDPASGVIELVTTTNRANLVGGTLRWLNGPHAGQAMGVLAAGPTQVTLDTPLDRPPPPGTPVLLREGCDRTLATCANRFGNAINFQGEPHLPGNDMLTRYPSPAA